MNKKEVGIVNTENKAVILQHFNIIETGKKYISYVDLTIKRQNIVMVGFVFTSQGKTVVFETKTDDEWARVSEVVKKLFNNEEVPGISVLPLDTIEVIDIVSSKELEIHLPEITELTQTFKVNSEPVVNSVPEAPAPAEAPVAEAAPIEQPVAPELPPLPEMPQVEEVTTIEPVATTVQPEMPEGPINIPITLEEPTAAPVAPVQPVQSMPEVVQEIPVQSIPEITPEIPVTVSVTDVTPGPDPVPQELFTPLNQTETTPIVPVTEAVPTPEPAPIEQPIPNIVAEQPEIPAQPQNVGPSINDTTTVATPTPPLTDTPTPETDPNAIDQKTIYNILIGVIVLAIAGVIAIMIFR